MNAILYSIFTSPIGYYIVRYLGFEGAAYLAKPHSTTRPESIVTAGARVSIIPVPCLASNYSYIIVDEQRRRAFIIDPSSHVNVLRALPRDVAVTGICLTHSHWDHCCGIFQILRQWPYARVYGNPLDPIPALTDPVYDREEIEMSESVKLKAIHVPCHTQGSLMYVLSPSQTSPPHVFSGDTLFSHGLGKFYWGNAEHLLPTLGPFLSTLPRLTKIWPGHEYALPNASFCSRFFPGSVNDVTMEALKHRRRRKEGCIPLRWEEERKGNMMVRLMVEEDCVEQWADVLWGLERVGEGGEGVTLTASALNRVRKMRDRWSVSPRELS